MEFTANEQEKIRLNALAELRVTMTNETRELCADYERRLEESADLIAAWSASWETMKTDLDGW